MKCVHCHADDVGAGLLGGYGGIGDIPLCHPDDPCRPDCYRMVTVYHHRLRDCPRCMGVPVVPPHLVVSHGHAGPIRFRGILIRDRAR